MNVYGYTDGTHSLSICFKCGRFTGTSGGDDEFIQMINGDPNILLEMIETKMLKPIHDK
jgi:hypothetical protein